MLTTEIPRLSLYLDQQYPTIKPKPRTHKIADKLNQMSGFSLVNMPNIKPKNAGAIEAFVPSETVGVSIKAKITIQLIPPNGFGKRFAIAYQHHKIMMLPNKYTLTAIVSSGIVSKIESKLSIVQLLNEIKRHASLLGLQHSD